ncbi:hypothetical protein BB559_002567 [Furculomyces boomerangus]|uniref:Mitochondrial dicarboxylate transporter n=1 Tax=Furculomyces boomerangus TaxID=61424 RepID=A0A2T9YU93_9FUNG|nr:hypothetical protein BB559_002567 [Furculomyces boomerangus]
MNNVQTPFYFGGVASVTASLFSHPGDLIKVRLQTYRGEMKSVLSVLFGIYRTEGIFGYFNGLSANILRQGTYSTVRFGVYEAIRDRYKNKNGNVSMHVSLIGGMIGGALGGCVGNPSDVALVRMQNDNKLPENMRRNYKNVFDGIFRIYREEGFKALYNGFGPNIGLSVVMTATQVGTYDLFKQMLVYFGMSGSSTQTHLASSILASLVAATAVSPIDVAKTRIMDSKTKVYSGLFDALIRIPREEKFIALFKGWTPAFLRLAPHTIIMFLVLERMKAGYIRYQEKGGKLLLQ